MSLLTALLQRCLCAGDSPTKDQREPGTEAVERTYEFDVPYLFEAGIMWRMSH
jgi:hypothetical protein